MLLLQLASESRGEGAARRGRLWSWPDLPGPGEVSEAIRLDIPSPLGARILLVADRPRSLRVPSSCAGAGRCCPGGQEPGRPTVENWPGIPAHLPGPAEKSSGVQDLGTKSQGVLKEEGVCTGLGGLGGYPSNRLAPAQVAVTSRQRVTVGHDSSKAGLAIEALS